MRISSPFRTVKSKAKISLKMLKETISPSQYSLHNQGTRSLRSSWDRWLADRGKPRSTQKSIERAGKKIGLEVSQLSWWLPRLLIGRLTIAREEEADYIWRWGLGDWRKKVFRRWRGQRKTLTVDKVRWNNQIHQGQVYQIFEPLQRRYWLPDIWHQNQINVHIQSPVHWNLLRTFEVSFAYHRYVGGLRTCTHSAWTQLHCILHRFQTLCLLQSNVSWGFHKNKGAAHFGSDQRPASRASRQTDKR